jgi:hypothetical protein
VRPCPGWTYCMAAGPANAEMIFPHFEGEGCNRSRGFGSIAPRRNNPSTYPHRFPEKAHRGGSLLLLSALEEEVRNFIIIK